MLDGYPAISRKKSGRVRAGAGRASAMGAGGSIPPPGVRVGGAKGGRRILLTSRLEVVCSKNGGMTPFSEWVDPPDAPKSMRGHLFPAAEPAQSTATLPVGKGAPA